MSDVLSTYTFLPWLRQGIANKITAQDLDPAVKVRATVNVKLDIVGTPVEGENDLVEEINKDIQLYGPGDIVGIDSKAIVKTEPRNWITNFEPNYLPYIEFYDEDFPWRYTPAAPNNKDRLRPWLALVVLKEDEFEDGKNMQNRPLSYFKLLASASDVMPPSAEMWAWAHVHVNEGLMADIVADGPNNAAIISAFENVLKKDPDLAYARIVCPRRLEPNVAYHAFLIPAFENGRLAGMGLDPSNTPYATFGAWDAYDSGTKEEPQHFPYYHRWYFRTGTVGDFEYLVRLLEPKPVDSRVGNRDMDVQRPGSNIQGITDEDLGGVLRLGGALRIPYDTMKQGDKDEFDKYDQWAEPYPHAFQEDLSAFLNLPDDYKTEEDPDPLITAPIYGKWHALINRVLKETDGTDLPQNKNWVHDLNLDPRFRVAAGFGTNIVQENQENYMNAAWKQVGDVLEANRKMRQAQLAKEVSWLWYNKHIKPISAFNPEKSFLLTAPMHKRVVADGLTVHHRVKQSKLALSFGAATMRRIVRPGGRILKALTFDASIRKNNLLERVDNDAIRITPPKVIPKELPTTNKIADTLMPEKVPQFYLEFVVKNKWYKWALLGLIGLCLLMLILFKSSGVVLAVFGVLIVLAGLLFKYTNDWYKTAVGADSLKEERLKREVVDDMPKSPDFRLLTKGDSFSPKRGSSDSVEAVKFKTALQNSIGVIDVSKQAGLASVRPALGVPGMVSATITAIDPEFTIPKLILNNIFIPERIRIKLKETFVEAMAYPEFDTPMYKPLVDISTELFLPNINYIGQNTISLLETNQRFIEAYMVGLNHEFARELLWREYPTDQRGSYFRQFWDVSSFYDDAGKDLETLKEALRDIPPLHLWSKFSNLGDHDHREEGLESEEELVLVIRGELLKKYPNAVIYAHKAKWNDDGGEIDLKAERRLVDLTDDQKENPPKTVLKTPLYEAKVDPDIYFFGFDLTAEEAKGEPNTDSNNDPGWFFVIKERPGEPRFGLDIEAEDSKPNVWNDLSWDKVMSNTEGGFISINNSTTTIPLEDPETNGDDADDEKIPQYKEDKAISWNKNMNAAEMAYILYQVPVLVAIHASEMLPNS